MSADFTISVDPDRDFVQIALIGLFTPDDVARFQAERDAAHARLRCAPNQHVTMTDVREMKIQPQDSVGAFRNILADPRAQSRRLAFLVPTTLTRKQLERAAMGRHAQFFYDCEEARAWLFS